MLFHKSKNVLGETSFVSQKNSFFKKAAKVAPFLCQFLVFFRRKQKVVPTKGSVREKVVPTRKGKKEKALISFVIFQLEKRKEDSNNTPMSFQTKVEQKMERQGELSKGSSSPIIQAASLFSEKGAAPLKEDDEKENKENKRKALMAKDFFPYFTEDEFVALCNGTISPIPIPETFGIDLPPIVCEHETEPTSEKPERNKEEPNKDKEEPNKEEGQ
jgi:hypothetical protein